MDVFTMAQGGGLKARLYHNPFFSPLGSWAEARFRGPAMTRISRYQQSAHPSELILESTNAMRFPRIQGQSAALFSELLYVQL